MIQGSAHMPERPETDGFPITALLQDWSAGEESALERLTPLVYQDLRRLAARRLRSESECQTLQPTALVHEAYLRLCGARQPDWENRSHFFGIAARLMRQILIQRARARHAEKRGGGSDKVSLDDAEPMADKRSQGIAELADALGELHDEDARKAQIVELRYFWGLTTEEIAAELRVSCSTVEREMRMALPWLRHRIERCPVDKVAS